MAAETPTLPLTARSSASAAAGGERRAHATARPSRRLPLLKVEALNQYYGGSHILRNVGFEAQLGEVTVVLGRNGVGKTTLLKSLMGVVPVQDRHASRSTATTSRATRRTSACAAASATCRRAARSSAA